MSLENSCANPAFPLPIGSLMPYMGLADRVPPTFLICDGRAVNVADYPELYRVLGDTFNGNGLVSEGEFLLPKLNDQETYLVPNGTLKTDPTQANAILTPVLHSSDDIPALAATNIPIMSPAAFTPTYPDKQVGLVGRTLNARGDYPGGRYYATDSTGSNTPKIVALNSSSEGGCFCSMTSADYQYVNPTPASLGNIDLNDDHPVQYGGMTCIYIIKAFTSYAPSASKNAAITQSINYQVAYKNDVAARETAVDTATGVADAQQDALAADEASAIADDGQGGGTEYEYADVPQLEGFRVPPTRNY